VMDRARQVPGPRAEVWISIATNPDALASLLPRSSRQGERFSSLSSPDQRQDGSREELYKEDED